MVVLIPNETYARGFLDGGEWANFGLEALTHPETRNLQILRQIVNIAISGRSQAL